MNYLLVQDLETSNTNFEALLYSTANGANFNLNSASIQCRNSYISSNANPTYSTVFYIQNALSFIAYDNQINFCNYGKYGVYALY